MHNAAVEMFGKQGKAEGRYNVHNRPEESGDNFSIAMKDEVNRIGKTHGYTETDFRKRGKNSRTSAEKKIILNGGTSWKEELREVIAEGIKRSKTPEAFKEYLNKCYGVKITRDGKDYSYLHPNKKQSEGRGSEHIIRKAR